MKLNLNKLTGFALFGVLLLFPVSFAQQVIPAEAAPLSVQGDVIGTVLPGETVTFRVRITNLADVSVGDISFEAVTPSSITGTKTNKLIRLGNLASEETRSGEIPLTISETVPEGQQSFTVRVTYSYENQLYEINKNFAFNVGSETQLYLSSLSYLNGGVEPGDTIPVRATILNVGSDPAFQVTASFESNSSLIKPVFAGSQAYRDSIAAGANAVLDFMINIDHDAEAQTYEGAIVVDYEDPEGNPHTQTFDIGLPVSGVPKLEVLNDAIDTGIYEVEVENLGNADAIAIRAELVQNGQVMSSDVDNELKPNKQSTLRFNTYLQGQAALNLRYLDDDNKEYTDSISLNIPETAASLKGGLGLGTIILIVVILGMGYYVYRLRKKLRKAK